MNVSVGAAGVVRAGEGRAVRWGPGGVVRVIAGADSTDGCFSVVEVTEEPGSAAPLHIHHGEAEGFYILEGTIELTCGEDTVTATAGDFVYGPQGVPHKYAVVGEQTARVLLLFSRPGFESFFLEAGALFDEPSAGPPDLDAFRRVAEKHGIELLETPGH